MLVSPRAYRVSLAALAGIVLVYSRWLHVNQTTVALTLLLLILALAARFSLRYAVAVSLIATVAYNYYFLPPIGTITIADAQNWLALFAFLSTAVVGSRLSQRARDEAEEAKARQREVELSFQLGRELLHVLLQRLKRRRHLAGRGSLNACWPALCLSPTCPPFRSIHARNIFGSPAA